MRMPPDRVQWLKEEIDKLQATQERMFSVLDSVRISVTKLESQEKPKPRPCVFFVDHVNEHKRKDENAEARWWEIGLKVVSYAAAGAAGALATIWKSGIK